MDQDGKESNRGSSANQQGIFSTPELPVDTEKLAQNAKANSTNTRSRVASIFANTDAGQRSQKLDDAMGMNNIQPAQVTEDVVISNGPRKKSKLPIIIAIVALVAVIGGLMGWMIMNNGKAASEETTSLEDAKKSFDRFATYILFGESSDELTGEYNRTEAYWLSLQASDDSIDEAFWNTSSELLKNAMKSYEAVTEKSDPTLLSYLQGYQIDFEFLKQYIQLGSPAIEQLIISYTRSGIDAAKEYIINFYAPLNNTSSSLGRSIREQKISQYSSYVDLVNEYNTIGCLIDNKLNDDCLASMTEIPVIIQQNLLVIDTASQTAHEDTRALVQNLERNCWLVSDRFINPLHIKDEELYGIQD